VFHGGRRTVHINKKSIHTEGTCIVMSLPILSICIPVYNREKLFRQSLACAVEAVRGYENAVEIVVSDNASTDPICEVVQRFTMANPRVVIRYSRLLENFGAATNVLEVVKRASGEFCWIIGSDDFVLAAGVSDVVEIIRNRPDIDFISVGFGSLSLPDYVSDGAQGSSITEKIRDTCEWKTRGPAYSEPIIPWDKLVDPKYNNVMLGSVMASVFRRQLWIAVNMDESRTQGQFSGIQNTYPHCYVFAHAFVGRNAWYHCKACVVVGDGAREWAADNGRTYWESFLPVIHLKLFDEIVDEYKKTGLDGTQVRRCRKWVGSVVGRWVVPYLVHRYVRGKSVCGQTHIDLDKIASIHWKNIGFYEGVARWIVRTFINRVKRFRIKSLI